MAMLLVFLLFLTQAVPASNPPEVLRRRADLGAVIRPPTATGRARVVRVDEGSPLERAGLRPNDEVVALNGTRLADPIDFDVRIAALRGGDVVHLQVLRDGLSTDVSATLAPLVRDRIPGVDVEYTHLVNPRGPRQRVIVTRPAAAHGRHPALLFVPWLSCDSVESPKRPAPGIDELLYRVAAESGFVMMRVDKPGVGDSEGRCADTDFRTELEGYRVAYAMLRQHPFVDPTRTVLMGQSFSGAFLPLVAGADQPAGYIVINSWSRSWYERLIEFERLQLEASGLSPGEVTERVTKLAELYTLFLIQKKPLREVFAERPDLSNIWIDEPEHQYGRPEAFHQQLQEVNPGRLWEKVNVPTMVIWGEADIVMHREDHERLVALVNRNHSSAATLITVPGMDHGVTVAGPDGSRHLPDTVTSEILRFLRRTGGGS
jgi:pimeloyl-ACP methyl ester carboxylesterase